MDRWEKGMLAKSMAGHDRDRIYVIMDLDEIYVYLADGKIRTLDRLKKKKKKHVQLIRKVYDTDAADDAAVRRILKQYRERESGMKEDQ